MNCLFHKPDAPASSRFTLRDADAEISRCAEVCIVSGQPNRVGWYWPIRQVKAMIGAALFSYEFEVVETNKYVSSPVTPTLLAVTSASLILVFGLQ